ncbi:MAG TPA: metallophosphoesterase [Burkholderiaceae bacterium]|nr:metallophosphoesterase [Burkholderiaceae bacterium]
MATLTHRFFNRKLLFSLSIAAAIASGGLYGCLTPQGRHTGAQSGEPAIAVPGKGVTVYAAGDIADCKKVKAADSAAARTAALIAAGLRTERDAAVISIGDHTYPTGLTAEFADCYGPTWGRFKDRTYPTPGNHEYYTPSATGYYDYFGGIAGPDRRGYYSYDLGAWHIVSLNSNLKQPEHQQQLEWLKQDLAQHPTKCTLAYWHHPLFSSGGHGNNVRMKEAWQILNAAHADVILAGHDHDYERFAPQDSEGRRDDARGMREFVVGTGGARLTPLRFRQAHSEISDNATFGVLRMVLKETGYEWEFLPVASGEFTDRGAALCH